MIAQPVASMCRSTLMTLALVVCARECLAQPCGQWVVAPNPVFEGVEFRPTLIAPLTADQAVAISTAPTTNGGGLLRTTWDGSTWIAAEPEALDLDNAWNPRAVTGSGPDDLWVCGLVSVDNFHGAPFLAHFDGEQWDVAQGSLLDDPTPDAGDPMRSGEGSSIAVIAPDDIWVVGYGDSPSGSTSSPVAFHWNGSSLEEFVPQIQPVYSTQNHTRAVAAAATDAVWIVGHGRHFGATFRSYIYRFDGQSWTPQLNWEPLPNQTILQDQLEDVVAFAHDDAWAFGKKLLLTGGGTQTFSMYLHWDGSDWSEVEGPDIGPITSAAGSGPDDIWASNAFGEYGGRLAHWDGVTWTEVMSAPIPDATHIGLTNLAASSFGDVWAVGYWAIYNGAGGWDEYVDIIEHFDPRCAGDLNNDGEVDTLDFSDLVQCQSGPGVPLESSCALADLDGDSDCDMADFAMLQRSIAP